MTVRTSADNTMAGVTRAGWLVAITGFIHLTITFGVISSFVVLFVSLEEEFETSAVATGWMGSLAWGVTAMFSPISTVLVARFGHRPISILGVLLCFGGLLVTAFLPVLWAMYLTFGMVFAAGTNMIMFTIYHLLSLYLPGETGMRQFALANLSGGVATLAGTVLIDLLMKEVGWRVTYPILSGIILVVCLPTCIFFKEPTTTACDTSGSTKDKESKMDQSKEDHLEGGRTNINKRVEDGMSYVGTIEEKTKFVRNGEVDQDEDVKTLGEMTTFVKGGDKDSGDLTEGTHDTTLGTELNKDVETCVVVTTEGSGEVCNRNNPSEVRYQELRESTQSHPPQTCTLIPHDIGSVSTGEVSGSILKAQAHYPFVRNRNDMKSCLPDSPLDDTVHSTSSGENVTALSKTVTTDGSPEHCTSPLENENASYFRLSPSDDAEHWSSPGDIAITFQNTGTIVGAPGPCTVLHGKDRASYLPLVPSDDTEHLSSTDSAEDALQNDLSNSATRASIASRVPGVWMAAFGVMTTNLASVFNVINLVSFMTTISLNERTRSLLLIGLGLAEIFGRIVSLVFGNSLPIPGIVIIVAVNIAAGVASLVIGFYPTITTIALYIAVAGITRGLFFNINIPVCLGIFQNVDSGVIITFLMFGNGLGGLLSSTFGGLSLDITGSYEIAFFTCSGLYFVSSFIFGSLRMWPKLAEPSSCLRPRTPEREVFL